MLASTGVYQKCGIIEVSHFPRQDIRSTVKMKWSYTCSPACPSTHDLTRHRFRYNMSSKVLSEGGRNAVTEADLQSVSLSSYEGALEKLSSLITRQRRGELPPIANKLEKMLIYLKILGLEEDINGLKIIHVAGTKGKGSTCIFCEAILQQCGFRTGVFTSPHLIDVCERFRIDGMDISEDKFLRYFWDCWNQLKENATEQLPMPPLFMFLTLLAFKIFISEQVDAAVIEVGLGGTEDATNVVRIRVVTVTFETDDQPSRLKNLLYAALLLWGWIILRYWNKRKEVSKFNKNHAGDTLGQIASHKAGIFKPKVPAFTVPQPSEAMDVILKKANELKVPLQVTEPLDCEKLKGSKLHLSGDHQLCNAGLAVSLSRCWLQRTGNWEKLFQNDFQDPDLPDKFIRGLSTAHFSGRGQIVYDASPNFDCSKMETENCDGNLIFYLDGAHSPESMEACAKWFSNAVRGCKPSYSTFDVKNTKEPSENGHMKSFKQILLFNCLNVRNPQILLPQLVNTCASSGIHFSKALFVPSMSKYSKITSGSSAVPSDLSGTDLSWQFNLQRIWEKIIHGKEMSTLIEEDFKMDSQEILPPHEFLYENASNCSPSCKNFASSAVMPSLPLTIKWLRDCVKEHPSTRLKVLVTGSLHLVGDVLKLLKK